MTNRITIRLVATLLTVFSAQAEIPTTTNYLIGTSYEPDWWPRSYWNEDFRKMHELGFNVVRMTEFSWASLEPKAGKFDFDWLDQAIELARQNSIAVILTTPTAGVPPWLYAQHPDVLGANEKGAFTYGGRKGAALNSPALRKASARIVTAMAEHFGTNANVIGWQINNEPGFPFANYDQSSLVAFRLWLKRHYGTIAKLNESWGGAFWSNQYNNWNEIEFPINSAEGGWRAGANLDYRRFFSDTFLDWLRFEAGLLRPHTAGRFDFLNWPDTLWSVDVFEASHTFPITAWDNYTPMPGLGDFHDQFYAELNHDLSRCSQTNQQFIVAEQLARAPANADPRGVRLQTFMDLAHGATGTLYYEWRPPIAANEAGYPSVLALDGTAGPEAEECRRINEDLARVTLELKDARTEADLAMIFSYDNEWDQGFWAGNTFRSKTGYDGNFKRYYAGLKILHRNIDVLPPGRPLNRYRMLVAPGLQMISDEFAESLNHYVEQGGILVLNAKSGTRQLDGRLRELAGPGVFSAATGGRITRFGTFRATTNDYFVTFGTNEPAYKVATIMEEFQPRGAETIGTFLGHGMAGKSAVTVNHFGKGHVVYVAAEIEDQNFYDELFMRLAGKFQIPPLLAAPKEVEVVSRHTRGYDYLFLLNLSDQLQTVRVPETGFEIIRRQPIAAEVSLPPFGVSILKVKVAGGG